MQIIKINIHILFCIAKFFNNHSLLHLMALFIYIGFFFNHCNNYCNTLKNKSISRKSQVLNHIRNVGVPSQILAIAVNAN